MKTLFMLLVFGLTFSLSNEDSTSYPANEADTVEESALEYATTTRGYVHFGRKKKNCTGFGICRAFISKIDTDKGIRTTFGIDGNRIIFLRWARKDVNKDTQKKYFAKGVFQVEEDTELTLESNENKFIIFMKEGKYKLREDGDGFLLEVSG